MPTGSLTRRTIAGSSLLALLLGVIFAVLLLANLEQRDAANQVRHARAELTQAERLLKMIVDLETGQRGFVITRAERFLEPWRAARDAIPRQARALVGFVEDPAQARRARRIERDAASYIRDYSVPLVRAVRRGDPSARSLAMTEEGKRRVDALRAEFERFTRAERVTVSALQARIDDDTERAIVIATIGLGLTLVLIALFGGYLAKAVVLPVRRAAAMAGRLAGGDLTVRMPETGVAEVGQLERAFNTMAASLEASNDQLRLLAEEQAALRRVATLVARAVPASELLDAVAEEVGRLLGADATGMARYDADGGAVVVAGHGEPVTAMTGRAPELEGENVTATVWRTGRPARMDSYEQARGPLATASREHGIRSSVGAPIVVAGRLWGVMVASWRRPEELSHDVEDRMAQFTELVATAISNADSRAELAASRARVVATADEARRRLQRDLHDGAQQRLVHTVITLKLARRELGYDGGPAAELVNEALGHAERATAELRDLSQGLLPVALRRGGLRAGVRTLVSRLRLPVSVDIGSERLSPALEAAGYFIVAEALTNVVKHAHADHAEVRAFVDGGALHLEIRDDGIGGAEPGGGSGLLGLHDRAAAMNGELVVESPPGGGTVLVATLPVAR